MKHAFESAFLVGVTPDQFWDMTPFAFGLLIKRYNLKLTQDAEHERWVIWHQAALTRSKKMPPLKKFVSPLNKKPERGINEAEIKSALKAYQNGPGRKPNG